jgi:ketosteroid isomerase-like protein
MSVRAVVERYYDLANTGDWNSWCDLFAEDMVLDEQLAGRVEGLPALRSMMAGFPEQYPSFQNRSRYLLVDGNQAAAVSHLRATTASGEEIEAEVMNYFQVVDDRITYLANFHDTVPFRKALDQ